MIATLALSVPVGGVGTSIASTVLAGEDQKSGPIGLAVILVLCVVSYLLFKSMSRHMRKVREEFPTGDGTAQPAPATPAPATPAPGTPVPVDEPGPAPAEEADSRAPEEGAPG